MPLLLLSRSSITIITFTQLPDFGATIKLYFWHKCLMHSLEIKGKGRLNLRFGDCESHFLVSIEFVKSPSWFNQRS